MGTTWPRLVFW